MAKRWKRYKLKFGDRWSTHEMRANIPILMSTPYRAKIEEMRASLRRAHQTRKNSFLFVFVFPCVFASLRLCVKVFS